MDENARVEVVAALEKVVENLQWSSKMTQSILGPNRDFDAGTEASIAAVKNIVDYVKAGGDWR